MSKKKKTETSGELHTKILRADAARCATQHFGAWSIEPKWFRSAIDAIRAGTFKPAKAWDGDDDDEDDGDSIDDDPLYTVNDGVAVICIDGQMMKRAGSFGGCSTISVRQAVRSAANDFAVRAIMLHICSPGGTVSGTADLAEDIANAAQQKPVDAYIADMGCSAAYWAASQCRTIYANSTALIGSIGTYALLEDDTGMQEQIGIKYRIVSTGEFKGLGADGAISDKLIADVQREINSLNALFLEAVAIGRGENIPDIAKVSDGRAWIAADSKQLGLIDEVASFDAAMTALTDEVSMANEITLDGFQKYAAEHPDAVSAYRNEGIAQGKKDGHAAGLQAERDRAKSIAELCADNHSLAVESIVAGHEPSAVKLAAKASADATAKATASATAHAAALAAKDAEIATLKEQKQFIQGTQPPVAMGGKEAPAVKVDPNNAESVAKAEWAKMSADQQSEWMDEANFVALRKAESKGQVKTTKAVVA